jgi:hypothetical protein
MGAPAGTPFEDERPMRTTILVASLSSWGLLSGCGTFVTATALNDAPRPLKQRRPEQVEVYASAPPSRPHVDMALLEVQQTEGLNEQGTRLMVRRLREEAGRFGCDAIFISGRSERDGAQPGSGWDLVDPGSHTLHATCIVYQDDDQGTSPPPQALTVPPPSVAAPRAGPPSGKPVAQTADDENPGARTAVARRK